MPEQKKSVNIECTTYLCSCMHIMSILCSVAHAVSLSSCPIRFNVLTLIVALRTVLLHLSNFCSGLGLSSGADFSNNLSRTRLLFYRVNGDVVWIFGWNENHDNLSIVLLYLMNKRNFYWWVAIVSLLNNLILVFDLWGSSVQHQGKRAVDPTLGSSTWLHIHHTASHCFWNFMWG